MGKSFHRPLYTFWEREQLDSDLEIPQICERLCMFPGTHIDIKLTKVPQRTATKLVPDEEMTNLERPVLSYY